MGTSAAVTIRLSLGLAILLRPGHRGLVRAAQVDVPRPGGAAARRREDRGGDDARRGGAAEHGRADRAASEDAAAQGGDGIGARAGARRTTSSRARKPEPSGTRRSRRPTRPPMRPSSGSNGATGKSTRRSSTKRPSESSRCCASRRPRETAPTAGEQARAGRQIHPGRRRVSGRGWAAEGCGPSGISSSQASRDLCADVPYWLPIP